VNHASSEYRLYSNADPHELWGIVYSSGTTGTPKGIVHSLLSIAMGYIGWSLELPLTRNSVVFVARPLFYMAGLEIASTTLLVGGTLLAPRQYSAAAYRRSSTEWKIDLAFFTPDHVRDLVEQARSGPRAACGADRILVMGSTLPLQIKLMLPEVLGSRVIESWGNSEGLGTIADDTAFALRPRSIGRPFLGDFMTVVDGDGEELPPWELGRVAGCSDAQLREYFHRDDLNESLFTDRLVLSEDLGYYDPDGYFYISGRVAGRFLRRGVPVFPTDIEDKLIDVHDILYSTVVGLPDDVEGHVPAAAVVLREGASGSETEILRAANERLPELHRLSKLLIVPSLPRNAAGKVVLDAVRGLFL
jgi:long-chain acyl-CoA synthetase